MSSGKRIAALAAGAAMFAAGPLFAQDAALTEAEPRTEPNRWFSYAIRSMVPMNRARSDIAFS
jgi:hypothetical protein